MIPLCVAVDGLRRHNQLLRFDADDHFPSAADAASSVPPPE